MGGLQYYHGMIEQIPEIIYTITNGKTKKYITSLGVVSAHHKNGYLFTDYELFGKTNIVMATPEKALFDTLYFQPAKSNLFSKLTEIEIPKHFDFIVFKKWLKWVKNKSRRVMIETQIEKLKKSN